MSLKNLIDTFQKEDLFQGMVVGKVIRNDDPMKQGRVKVEIPSFTEGLPESVIPWSHQMFPIGTGTTDGIPSFKIPALDTQVVMIFPEKDIYSSFYIGELVYDTHKLEELLSDYPETYGFIDKMKNKYWVNMAQGTIDMHHHSGTHVNIEDDGTINLDGVVDLNINITGNSTLNIDGNSDITIGGNLTSNVGGDQTTDITGNLTATVGGDTVIDVSGATTLTSGGDTTINASKLVVNCDITVTGKIESTGDQIAGIISTQNHKHIGNLGSPTSPSIP